MRVLIITKYSPTKNDLKIVRIVQDDLPQYRLLLLSPQFSFDQDTVSAMHLLLSLTLGRGLLAFLLQHTPPQTKTTNRTRHLFRAPLLLERQVDVVGGWMDSNDMNWIS